MSMDGSGGGGSNDSGNSKRIRLCAKMKTANLPLINCGCEWVSVKLDEYEIIDNWEWEWKNELARLQGQLNESNGPGWKSGRVFIKSRSRLSADSHHTMEHYSDCVEPWVNTHRFCAPLKSLSPLPFDFFLVINEEIFFSLSFPLNFFYWFSLVLTIRHHKETATNSFSNIIK